MANTVQIKRGNNTSVNAHTGPSGEIIYNLDTGRLHAQDGSTAGGKPHALVSDVDLKANAAVDIIAGNGLTGGGTLAASRTLALNSTSIASLAKADTAVQSVNGKSGSAVALVKGDVGLGNVDNTSDLAKPISTLTQTALNAKANSAITVTAGSGLTGGGNLTANRTVALNAASIASLGKADTALQAPGGSAGQILVKNSNTTNDVGWVSSEVATAVSYGTQTLTEAQQVQARQNIQADKSYDSISSVAAATVPAFANAIRTNGYYAAGDGGGALYKRVATEPSHAGKVQSADGAWWELAADYVTPNMFGAKCDGVTDDAPAINAAWDYANSLTTIGAALNLVATKVYYVGTSIQLGPYSGKQRILEGNGAHIKVLPSFSGYMFDSDNSAGIFAWMIGLRNFTAEGIYGSSDTNFIRARHVNGLNLDFVFIQSFNLAFNLASSYAVSVRNTHLRYIKQHAFLTSTSSMQLKLIDCRVYGMNEGAGVAANPLFINTAANANIIMIGCDFEGGKSNFFYTSQPVRQLYITGSYIEGFELNPLNFDADVTAFVFEGNWLGYNAGAQQWKNVKSGRISGNVFAQQTTTIGTGNADVFSGNNSFIDGSNLFNFRVVGVTPAAGATPLDLPGYKKTPDGIVICSGRISRTGNGELFTFPVGYRPMVDCSFLTAAEGSLTLARIDVSTAGVVTVNYASGGGGVRLDCVSFLA